MVVGAIGTVLAAGYFLWMLQKVNFGEPGAEWEAHDFHDVDRWEMAAWAPLVVTIIAIGVFPKVVFGATNDAVTAMVQSVFGG
jgi:NADH-quinone oxidoreductase subunit M